MTFFSQAFKTLTLAIILSIGISYAYAAWAPPTSAPTGGNAEAPLNVGSATQLKAGGLGVNGLLHAYSNAVVDQKVGIGITSPIGPLTINDTSGSPWVDIRSNGDANNYSAISLWSNAGGAWPIFSGADSNKRWAIGHRKIAGETNNFFIEECNGNCLQGNPVNYAQRLTIKPGGNIGISQKDPTAKLHIGGTPGVDGIRFPDGTLQKTAAGGGLVKGSAVYQCPVHVERYTNAGNIELTCFTSCVGQITKNSTCAYDEFDGNWSCRNTGKNRSCAPITGYLVQ